MIQRPGRAGDFQIKHDVLEELKCDACVEHAALAVDLDKAVVTLTGSANTYAAKLGAEEAARRVTGVVDVANNIRVRVPRRGRPTDPEMVAAIRETFHWNALVPQDRIDCAVSNGAVTLKGDADSWSQRQAAVRAVADLAGVSGVTNRIRVDAPNVHPQKLREAVGEALRRRGGVMADNVQVTVKDGTVTVAGVVRSWLERRAVIEAAGGAPGVREVVDRLTVRPLVSDQESQHSSVSSSAQDERALNRARMERSGSASGGSRRHPQAVAEARPADTD